MSQRLDELIEQRAAIVRHLKWLDKQIENERNESPASPGTSADKESPSIEPPPGETEDQSEQSPEEIDRLVNEILSRYQTDPEVSRQNIRKGCWLYAVFFLLLFFLSIMLWILFATPPT